MRKAYDDDNDVSRIFARNTERGFRREFNLPSRPKNSEGHNKINQLSVKLIEAEEKIDSLNRALESKNREIEKLSAADVDSKAESGQLRVEIQELKAQIRALKQLNAHTEERKLSNKILMDDLRTALSKFRTWYTYAEAQMDTMKTILQEAGKWNTENRYKIYFSYKDISAITVADDEIASLCQTSVLDYPGVEEIESITSSESQSSAHTQTTVVDMSTQTDQMESGFIQTGDELSRPSSQAYASQSKPLDSSFCGDDWRYLEYVEKVQKLESEIAKLKNESIILKQRERENVLLEEQKNDVENQLNVLKQQNLAIIAEHEKLKNAVHSQLFQDLGRHSANEIIQKIAEVRERNEELEKKLAEMGNSSSRSEVTESKQMALFFKQKYQAQIDELQKKLSQFQQPSESTCVYRFQVSNPLDEAYEEYLLSQAASSAQNSAKRRKLDSTNSDGHGGSEELQDLRIKIEQQERKLKFQKESALSYRHLVSMLTGYQIKMRDDNICEVQSVFGQGGALIFKRHEETGLVGLDLLENEAACQWSNHVKNYLVKYDSIPAFLASVVLALVENDATMLSTSVLDYTKDTQEVL